MFSNLRRVDDDPFNTGWNAALDEVVRHIQAMPAATDDDIFSRAQVLVTKADVLKMLGHSDEKGAA